MASELPLIVIVGPTASGKTRLAVELAERYDGEIICADSRTIYRGFDVGTAKPTKDEQQRVPHWGIDLIDASESYSVADFQRYAYKKIVEIRARGHTPFLVGGTGLYIDAVIYNYRFRNETLNVAKRTSLERVSISELVEYCIENNIKLPNDTKNKRHLIRAIERDGTVGSKNEAPLNNCYIVGIATEKDVLMDRIRQRSEHLFDSGVVAEAKMLGELYGWEIKAMTGNIYPPIHAFIDGEIDSNELVDKVITADRQLAKRQLTWFRRSPHITWCDLPEAHDYITSVLNETRS